MNEVQLIGFINEAPKDTKDPFYEGVWRTRSFIQVKPDPKTRECEKSKYDTIRIYATDNYLRNELKKFKVGDPIVILGSLKNDFFDNINVLSVQIRRIEFPPLSERRYSMPKQTEQVKDVLDEIDISDFDNFTLDDLENTPF